MAPRRDDDAKILYTLLRNLSHENSAIPGPSEQAAFHPDGNSRRHQSREAAIRIERELRADDAVAPWRPPAVAGRHRLGPRIEELARHPCQGVRPELDAPGLGRRQGERLHVGGISS